MFQVNALVYATEEPAVSQMEAAEDILIINDAHKLAFFGWYMASQMPSTGWDLLNRTLAWATSYILPNETKIVFFTLDGTVTPEPGNEHAAAVYDWLASAGYMVENIELHPIGDAGTLPSTYYDGFDLVLYWNVEGVDSTNIVASGVPFITVSAPQSADMGIATGMYTTYEERDIFYVVSNNYFPTQRYALGPLLFESAIGVDASEATTHGRVLVKAEVESVCSQVEMSLMQDVEVSDVGSANMTFTLNIPEGPLANMYVESFFTRPPIDPEVEVPVPENKTEPETLELEEDVADASLPGDINGDGVIDIMDIVIAAVSFGTRPGDLEWDPNADICPDHIIDIFDLVTIAINFGGKRQPPPEMTVPVREVFHQGIFMEQDVLLGFGTVIVDSKILPRGVNNETQISVNSYSPQLAKLNASIWRINVGPQDEEAANVSSEFMVTKIQYIQQMLQMLPGDQVYLYNWVMRIRLPTVAEFLNMGELNGLNWTVDFGGGSYIESNLTALPAEVIVNEAMLVTEHNMTASEDYLWTAFSQYKVFQIDYRLPGLLSSQTASIEEPCTLGTEDWSKTFTLTFSTRVPTKTWKLGPLTTKVEVNPTLTIQWYIGWSIRRLRLQWFETWVSVSPSVKVYAYAGVTASCSKDWDITLATLSKRFRFSIGWFPVWANIKLTIGAGISVEAYGTISISATATASAWFKAGVKWVRDSGWSGIWDHGWGASLSGPTITAEVGITVTPYATAHLALLLYDVAGPFVEVRPYAPISVTFNPRKWSIDLKFKIIAGVTMSGWLKKLLGFGELSGTLWDGTLQSWSGTW
jgi:hypothetical protein